MDGRVYAAGELRIACTRGCAAGGSTVGYCITQMRFWSSGQCVHASPCSSQSLGILGDAVARRRVSQQRSVCAAAGGKNGYTAQTTSNS